MNPLPMSALTLVRPAREHVPSYFAFIDDMRAHNETVWPPRVPKDGDTHDDFVARLLSKETTPDEGMVPETVHWGLLGDDVVGVIALRHHLTESLARFGGHIGYEVRPSARRRGVATAMIARLLDTERARAMGKILVTCAPTNVGSRRAIEANGFVLKEIVFVESVQRDTCHYVIDLAD